MHLRPPSVDHGVQAFIWAVVFFLFLWFGMLAVGVSGGGRVHARAHLGALIFLFVRSSARTTGAASRPRAAPLAPLS